MEGTQAPTKEIESKKKNNEIPLARPCFACPLSFVNKKKARAVFPLLPCFALSLSLTHALVLMPEPWRPGAATASSAIQIGGAGSGGGAHGSSSSSASASTLTSAAAAKPSPPPSVSAAAAALLIFSPSPPGGGLSSSPSSSLSSSPSSSTASAAWGVGTPPGLQGSVFLPSVTGDEGGAATHSLVSFSGFFWQSFACLSCQLPTFFASILMSMAACVSFLASRAKKNGN